MKSLSARWRGYILAYILVVPSFLFLSVFTYWPVANSFLVSLTRYDISTPKPVFQGVTNYLTMFGSALFWRVLRNNALYSLFTVAASVTIGLSLSLLIQRRTLRLKSLFRLSVFYPYVLPMAAASMVWLWLMNPSYGVVNILLGKLGLPAHIDWVNEGGYSLPAIIIVAVWKYSGYYSIIFLAGLQSIDSEYYEAATLEGAGGWQKLRAITLPLLSPTTFFVLLLAVINSFQSVDQVYVMTQGGPYDTSNVLLYFIYQNAFMYGDLGYGSALSFFLLLILLIGTAVYFLSLGRFVHYER